MYIWITRLKLTSHELVSDLVARCYLLSRPMCRVPNESRAEPDRRNHSDRLPEGGPRHKTAILFDVRLKGGVPIPRSRGPAL